MTTTDIDYGMVCDYATGAEIRPATLAELTRSLDAAASTCDGTGCYRDRDGRTVYVSGESNAAHRLAGGKGHAE